MADLDLTPIVEAVARARWERASSPHLTWDRCVEQSPGTAHSIREAALVDVLAAVPLIREQIAQQIEAAAERRDRPGTFARLLHPEHVEAAVGGMRSAAHIARGGAS